MASLLGALVRLYSRFVSPLLPRSCRFHPNCSSYARQALVEYGAIRGTLLSLRRIARCHPWSAGGFDPIPGRKVL
ncbi:MAG: membrane protein insertion efficiency factor YidD [Actinomycetota bacterium]